MNRIALMMSDAYSAYNFGEHHPLKPERVLLTWKLIKALHLHEHENCVVLEPRLATDEELELLHTKDYITFVKRVSRELDAGPLPEKSIIEGFKYNLGPGDNPVFKKMHEGSAVVVGGTIVACDTVWDDNGIDKAFNAGGGLHHAAASKASGFCIYNDPAIGIAHLLKKHAKENPRIAYIDVDAHHGDGVQEAFYNNPNVLTISFHESGKFLFPGTGFSDEIGEGPGEGFAVNLPLLPNTWDSLYIDIFEDVVPKLLDAFNPDIILSQNGVDTHCTDPLAQLGLTTKGHVEIFKQIHKAADKYAKGKLVAVGGGGYNISVVPRSWTMLFAELLGVLDSLPGMIPGDIIEELNAGRHDDFVPNYFIDPGPSAEIKQYMNDFKFMDMMENYAAEIKYKILNTNLPLIESRS